MKIAYAGFDLFYPALEALYQSGCEIVRIFSCSVDNVTEFNTSVTDFAHEHNIPITYDKITLDDLRALQDSGVDALFCAAYYYRMPILKGFKMINIHPSLLPLGRGAWPMPVCILNNESQSGVTFHKMEESFDTGDILMQKAFELSPDENLDTFMDKIYALIPSMIEKLMSDFENIYDNATVQGEGEYWDAPDEYDYVITPDTSLDDADRILRAFYGFYTIYRDSTTEYKLLRGRAVCGDNIGKEFKIKGGYIVCDKTE